MRIFRRKRRLRPYWTPARKSKKRQAAESIGSGVEAGAWYEAGSRSSSRSPGGSGGGWSFLDNLFD